MEYLSTAQAAKAWGISERSVRNYCASGRVEGARLVGKTWQVPKGAQKPPRKNAASPSALTLLDVLRTEKKQKTPGGIYHKVQVDLTYNSNHIEGSRLTHDQTRYIFETNTIGCDNQALNVDDIVETTNHFTCIDAIIDAANTALTERFIKNLHATLKRGTSDARQPWFAVGEYKKMPNEVGGNATTPPEHVARDIKALLDEYNSTKIKTLEDILNFHVRFERIHSFQDGNGRVGRLIMFKECLRSGITPFIITDDMKLFYYRGLAEWDREPGYLTDTCLAAQDQFRASLEYFRIETPENLT